MSFGTKQSPFSDVVSLNRRGFMLAGGSAAGVLLAGSGSALAQSGTSAANAAPSAMFKVGAFEVTTILDGSFTGGEPQKTFGMNQDAATFAAASEANFIPSDSFRAYFTPTLVKAAGEVILFDTGSDAGARPARGNLVAGLAAAGVAPEDVTIVVITHMHPDHIGGLITDGAPSFPNARYVAGAAEHNFWAAQAPDQRIRQLMDAEFTPLIDKAGFVNPGDSIVSGVTAREAFGHTPGHMTYVLESEGQVLHVLSDTANHFVWSVAYPEWEVRFDMDKAAAAATRRKTFDMLLAEKQPFIGYHMPFPAVGFIEQGGGDAAYRFVPASYQLTL